MTKRKENWQGMNWIRQSTRLAIYLRDGLSCVYCGANIEDGVQLSLDHLKPVSKTGKPDNSSKNLVTCCLKCNSARGNRSVRDFCIAVAIYLNHGIEAKTIERHVRACARRSMTGPRKQSLGLIKKRGSVSKVLANKE